MTPVEGVRFITMVVQAELMFLIEYTTPAAVILDLFQDPFMGVAHPIQWTKSMTRLVESWGVPKIYSLCMSGILL